MRYEEAVSKGFDLAGWLVAVLVLAALMAWLSTFFF